MSGKRKIEVLKLPTLPSRPCLEDRISEAAVFKMVGRVSAVTGDAIELEGMSVPLGAICLLTTQSRKQVKGRVIGFRGLNPILSPLESLESVAAGDTVELVDYQQYLWVGDSLCGRVVDAFGQPLDGQKLPSNLSSIKAEREPPASLDRRPINHRFSTGVKLIDACLTCGRGQRLGVFAGSGIGKSTLLGMLANGSEADRIVIAMVGERGREVQEFIQNILGDEGLSRSVVVVATSDKPAAQRVAAAWTATSIAESFRDEGHHVLLLFDSITRFAMAQRELGLASGEPPTTKGYPPSAFQALPRLVERAGCNAIGAITAFYTVLVEGDDQQEPIADALRGLLDGHIVLSRDLAEEFMYPAIDLLQSISRLQPRLVDQVLADAVGELRRLMAIYRRNADLITIGAYRRGSDENIDAAILVHELFKKFAAQDSSESVDLIDAQNMLIELVNSLAHDGSTSQGLITSQFDPIGTSVDL